MKIVFLDFDGVINPGYGPWRPELVRRLNKVTDTTGAKIVVHSSWRWSRSLDELRKILTTYHVGVPVTGEVLDACLKPFDIGKRYPNIPRKLHTDRAIAIQTWLDDNGPVEGYVILDDSGKMGHFVGTPAFIQTDIRVGLTGDQADQAIQHLKGVTW